MMSQELQVLLSSETNEWYTPPFYIDLVKSVMGDIDLDPASSDAPQSWIKAKHYYTISDDGLMLPWLGRVFLNPPYGKLSGVSNQQIWLNRLLCFYSSGHVPQSIILLKAAIGYKWFSDMVKCGYPVCFTYDLIEFVHASRSDTKKSKLGAAFVYLGSNPVRFRDVFSSIGFFTNLCP